MQRLLSILILILAGSVALAATSDPDDAGADAAAATVTESHSETDAMTPREISQEYRIQPGDVLLISVWKEEDLKGEVLVQPDGGLAFPLAGELTAAGKTVAELRVELTQRLEHYIPKPVVTVSVRAINGNHIYVLGKVMRPGEYPFTRPLDVMQALSLAGGTAPFAALNDITILRRLNGKQHAINFRYADVERGRELGQNIVLQSGDTVVVP